MLHVNKIRQMIMRSLSVLFFLPGVAAAYEPVCPQTDYAFEDKGSYACHYADGISLSYSRWKSCPAYFEYYYKQEVEVQSKDKQLWLYSTTHPVMVYVKLNKKEFKKKRRDYWIAKGREFLREVEKTAINCADPNLSAPQLENDFIQTRPSSANRGQELVPEKSMPPSTGTPRRELAPEKKTEAPAEWDDWDAPAPKAKSRD